jgi:hypothetical protein
MIDPILLANDMALEAHRTDFEFVVGADGKEQMPEHGGPTRTSRVLAIAHLAMYDAWNSVSPVAAPYLAGLPRAPTTADAGVAALAATAQVLKNLYARQKSAIEADLGRRVAAFVEGGGLKGDLPSSLSHGAAIGDVHLKSRAPDPSGDKKDYKPLPGRGHHRLDPFDAKHQEDLGPLWGDLKPFGVRTLNDTGDTTTVAGIDPKKLDSPELQAQFTDVKGLGAARNSTRKPWQTLIGTFWGYDGAKRIGTPPRLYNQAVRALAAVLGTTPAQNAQLFALINMGMADAGIFAWKIKYQYNVWRPVIGIREEAPTEPRVPPTTLDGDPSWAPLGAPQTNRRVEFQTPNFPAYPSGHATFGTAAFRLADLFLSREFPGKSIKDTPFTLISDEYNGVSLSEDGSVRPLLPRQMTIVKAIEENKESRIYLGVHWLMDAEEGARVGEEIAMITFKKQLLKPPHR